LRISGERPSSEKSFFCIKACNSQMNARATAIYRSGEP
jgi:hypothetical protein